MTRLIFAMALLATPAIADCNPEWCGRFDTNNPQQHQWVSGDDPADVGPAPAEPPAPPEPEEPSDDPDDGDVGPGDLGPGDIGYGEF